MPGPAPTPTALKILAGNPGKRPLNENEPQPEPAIPSAPDHLSDEARQEWERVVPELFALGLLSHVDRAALAAYCAAYGRWVEAERMIREHGMTQLSPNGYVQQSPHLSIANKALAQMKAFLTEFGMTPSSRSKVAAQPKEDTDDARFFG